MQLRRRKTTGDSTRLYLEPGDRLVVETDAKLGEEDIERILEGLALNGIKDALIFDRGLRVGGVIRGTENDAKTVEASC